MAAGTMVALAASVGQIDTSSQLWAFELYGKVFIVNGTNRKVADFVNVKITVANLTGNPPDFGTLLTGGTSGAKMVVDYITALSGATTIYGRRTTTATFSNGETVTGTDDDDNAISFTTTVEVAGPHWYNWTPFGNSSTFGVIPDQLTLGCAWNGRAVVAGNEADPNQWYMTKQGNPWHFIYVEGTVGGAVSGEESEAGKSGDVIVAVIPHSRDYLVFGCANTIWYLAGDPTSGGTNITLDNVGGILDSQAWCKDRNDNLYILATTGLLRVSPEFGKPENLLEETYPDFLKDLAFNGSLHRLVMGYDRKRNGIKIAKTVLTTGVTTAFWYDLRSGGLFPESYPEECGIYSMYDYQAIDPDYSGLIHGSRDGYARVEIDTAKDDDIGTIDEAIDSYVTFGPLALSQGNKEGVIHSLIGELTGGATSGSEQDSNDVAFKIFTARSADEISEQLVANSGQKVSGTLPASGRPRGSAKKRRVRGVFAGIRIGNSTAAQTWGLERLLVDSEEKGRVK